MPDSQAIAGAFGTYRNPRLQRVRGRFIDIEIAPSRKTDTNWHIVGVDCPSKNSNALHGPQPLFTTSSASGTDLLEES
jgi:predicted Zn-dependent protease